LEADGIVGPRTRAKLFPEKRNENKDAPAGQQERGRYRWLARGAMGEAVKEVQQTLGVQADGFFGPRTEQAVKEFQAAHSLDADGIVGPRTQAELTRVQTANTEKKEAAPPQVVPAVVAPSAPAPVPQSAEMVQLVNMGFPDVNLNAELLKKHNGDVEQVVAELIGA